MLGISNALLTMQIQETNFGMYKQLCLINKEKKIRLCVLPELGGMLQSLDIRRNKEWVPILWTSEYPIEFITKHLATYSGSKLFPFPNRINGGNYCFNNKKMQLPCNEPAFPHALHGLVYNKPFQIESSHQILKLTYRYDGEIEGYTFPYHLNISYIVQENGITITSEVTNMGNTLMPVGDGWHPYIALGGKVDDWNLSLPGNKYYLTNEKYIPTQETALFPHKNNTLIGDIELNHCFEIHQPESDYCVTKISNPNTGIGVEVWQKIGTAQYNYVQYYIPKERNCIAIEPMTCIPDAFNNKIGLILLTPGESQNWMFGIKIIMRTPILI